MFPRKGAVRLDGGAFLLCNRWRSYRLPDIRTIRMDPFIQARQFLSDHCRLPLRGGADDESTLALSPWMVKAATSAFSLR